MIKRKEIVNLITRFEYLAEDTKHILKFVQDDFEYNKYKDLNKLCEQIVYELNEWDIKYAG